MNIKGAIFDMDGTLVDSLGLWDVLWDELTRRYALPERFVPDEVANRAIRTLTLADSMAFIYHHHGVGNSAEELFEVAHETFMRFYQTRVELKRGVRELLDYYRATGVKMCIASAGNMEHVEAAMDHCGIRDYFTGILSCRQVGKGKEAPDIYELAIEHLGTPREETWVFEDSIVAFRTAHAMGVPTVGVYDKFGFDHEEMKEKSTVYIGPGESFAKMIPVD